MSRYPRKNSVSDCYHVTIRAINRQQIFESSGDYRLFLTSMERIAEDRDVLIHAYCLMSNHVHLLLEARHHVLVSEFMKALEDSFVYRYNHEHQRCGILFQGRFYSVPIEDERQYLSVLRYIHQNPMRAGIETQPGTYHWSSYWEYYRVCSHDFLYRERVLHHFPEPQMFYEFMDTPLPASETVRWRAGGHLDDELVIRLVCELAACRDLAQARTLEVEERNQLIWDLAERHVPQVTIARMLGLSKSQIGRILSRLEQEGNF